MTSTRPTLTRLLAGLPALLVVGFFSRSAQAAPSLPLASWNEWWINTNFAEHGKSIDQIFYFIFWLTSIITVIVELVLVWFLFKYRRREGVRKSIYSHGNTRLEMIWTLIPAIVLIVLALWTKRVWDNYRYSPSANDPATAKILVIGEQFQWSTIYGGPKNKIGRFLVFPKTTDLNWPAVPEGQSFAFPDVKGPAYLPEEQARTILNNYIAAVNPLGRDFTDPDTNPDPTGDNPELARLNDRSAALGRPLILPKGRPVEIQLGSRDVIHDFFLPNFRSRLDVVPGMRGKLYITASNDCPGPQLYSLKELEDFVSRKVDLIAIVNKNTPGAELYSPGRRKPKFWRLADKDKNTFLTNGTLISADVINSARSIGLTHLMATITYDLVCEELCGMGHAKMQGKVIVLDNATLQEPPYNNYFPPLKVNSTQARGDSAVPGVAVAGK